MSTYTWTDNPMEAGVSQCDPDVVNNDLMYLKYDHRVEPNIELDLTTQTLIIG